MDFFKVELIVVGIVQESPVDCGGFADMVKSLNSFISSCEPQFCVNFSGKSVLLEAFLEELLLSAGSNVSEMLEESIWDWFTTSMSGNSICEKSDAGTEPVTEGVLFGCFGCSINWISSPLSETRIALFWGTLLRMFLLPIWGAVGGRLQTFGRPLSSKNSASSWGTAVAMFIMPEPVEEDWFCRIELSLGKLPSFFQHLLKWPIIWHSSHLAFLTLHWDSCFLL